MVAASTPIANRPDCLDILEAYDAKVKGEVKGEVSLDRCGTPASRRDEALARSDSVQAALAHHFQADFISGPPLKKYHKKESEGKKATNEKGESVRAQLPTPAGREPLDPLDRLRLPPAQAHTNGDRNCGSAGWSRGLRGLGPVQPPACSQA